MVRSLESLNEGEKKGRVWVTAEEKKMKGKTRNGTLFYKKSGWNFFDACRVLLPCYGNSLKQCHLPTSFEKEIRAEIYYLQRQDLVFSHFESGRRFAPVLARPSHRAGSEVYILLPFSRFLCFVFFHTILVSIFIINSSAGTEIVFRHHFEWKKIVGKYKRKKNWRSRTKFVRRRN